MTALDPAHRDEPPGPVSGRSIQIEQHLVQDEAGALGLVNLLKRFGYVAHTQCREACWEALIRGHGESWHAAGKTAVEALDAALHKMVPCELGRGLLRDAIAENRRNEPSAPSCT